MPAHTLDLRASGFIVYKRTYPSSANSLTIRENLQRTSHLLHLGAGRDSFVMTVALTEQKRRYRTIPYFVKYLALHTVFASNEQE